MSLLAQLILAEKYGMRLDMQELASELDMAKGTLMNQISAGTLGIKTYMDGGKRWADVRDVAAHYDRMRERAEA
ncbi:MAG: hypothetical protein KKD97_15965 [Gammaproteobacteria bacterium]|nr:hypothetical protein [Gammaproteobacteria bacterium]